MWRLYLGCYFAIGQALGPALFLVEGDKGYNKI